ncbi:helix-turn-helix domain-containing protein [Plantactinospora sp. B6F1]|uniref:winged helix-turn-helix transcriptional regulator n=1 Tax=Plantactinospora sp. B6F1 TaxID=3158971 RepID=UPI00102C5A70
MRSREYGQFCGLARAAEVLGQRWTLLILRDLLVGPRRFSDLVTGLPGIPTNLLSTRLRELEGDGLVTRELQAGQPRSVVYRATPRARQLAPALDELGRWGAATMRKPRDGEVVTDASLVAALRAAANPGGIPSTIRKVVYVVRSGTAIAHVTVRNASITVEPGECPDPDLVLVAGPNFRDLLAGELEPDAAVDAGAVALHGDDKLLAEFVAVFRVPYADPATNGDRAGPTTPGDHLAEG